MKRIQLTASRCAQFLKPAGIAALGIAVCATAVSSAAADDPDVIYLKGTVRDFLKDHPDFNITSSTGHVANNVVLSSAQNRPTLTGDGFAVGSQWTTKDGDEIAPHLFYNGGTLLLGAAPDWNPDNVEIDSWDSSEGTYDPDSTGDPPPMQWPAPMPEVSPPGGLSPHPDYTNVNANVVYGSNTTAVIDFSFQARSLTAGQSVTLEIAPNTDVVIYTTRDIDLGQNCAIIVPPTSTLRIYFDQGGMKVGQGSVINMTQPLNPARCIITNLGNSDVNFHQTGGVCAQIVSPYGDVNFNQANEIFGTIVAKGLKMDQGSKLHWDGMPLEVCDELIADFEGASSGANAAAVTSAESFNQWFTDVPGTNLSVIHTIALIKNASGIYEYLDNEFFPIDDVLFGNEGDPHNFNFTFTFNANFVHEQCEERFFEFMGADDAWVYINGELAMDLGGVMPLQWQRIELDRLELEDGETYTLHFFFAQRNPFESIFNVKTDIPLESNPPPVFSAPYD